MRVIVAVLQVVLTSACDAEPIASRGLPTDTPGAPDGFCLEGEWTYCEDFDGRGTDRAEPYPYPGAALEYHDHSRGTARGVSCETSGDCAPYLANGAAFTNAEDSGFGVAATRVLVPFDFAGREGHIHFEATLNANARMVLSMQLAPRPTVEMPQVHDGTAMDRATILNLSYHGNGGSPILLQIWEDGAPVRHETGDGPLAIDIAGLHAFDVYVTRTTVRLAIDGIERFRDEFDDLGFDVAYLKLAQTAYNPALEGALGAAANTFQWDNIAFDGPAHPPNGLTPLDAQDVTFRAYSASTCTVRGVEAEGPPEGMWASWNTWYARVPLDGGPVTVDEIACEQVPETPPAEFPGPYVQDLAIITQ